MLYAVETSNEFKGDETLRVHSSAKVHILEEVVYREVIFTEIN